MPETGRPRSCAHKAVRGARHKSESRSLGRSAGGSPAVARAPCPRIPAISPRFRFMSLQAPGFDIGRERDAPAWSFYISCDVAGRFPKVLSRSVTHGYSHENACAKHLGVRRLDAALVLLPGVTPRRRRAAALQGASHRGTAAARAPHRNELTPRVGTLIGNVETPRRSGTPTRFSRQSPGKPDAFHFCVAHPTVRAQPAFGVRYCQLPPIHAARPAN
jgi:hypothetical protein